VRALLIGGSFSGQTTTTGSCVSSIDETLYTSEAIGAALSWMAWLSQLMLTIEVGN
jgi:hypothetical protein